MPYSIRMNCDRHLNWVEVSRASLAANVRRFRNHIGRDVLLAAVVKANAYGHGLTVTAHELVNAGVDWLAVNSLDEAAELRDSGLRSPIICLGYVPLSLIEEAVTLDLRLTVYNQETIERAAAAADRLDRDVRLHIKVETGTQRQGVEGKPSWNSPGKSAAADGCSSKVFRPTLRTLKM